MFYGDEVGETVTFIEMMDKFFDCLNVRNNHEGRFKRNPNLNPYTDVNDVKLNWLMVDFLGYFQEWEDHVNNLSGLSQSEKTKMLLSHQTRAGIQITVKSIVSCVKILLNSGAPFVLTHAFNQDPLEEHFGHYRHKGEVTTTQQCMTFKTP